MSVYEEVHRPRFHFTARENWINDPNGLVYFEGVWHLFFQHNPDATVWGNMTWGHAVSKDLIHWRQTEHALLPDEHGTMFSGSAVVDWNGSAGYGEQTLLIFYTAAGGHVYPQRRDTQCLAYSIDGGDTWLKHASNPTIDWYEANNRDPKVIWHEPSHQWIMALYLAEDRYCLLKSSDAKNWSRFQDLTLSGDSECPDFFPLQDSAGVERWVFWGASGLYTVGSFDGESYRAETEVLTCERGTNGYAAQTYSDTPCGRRIQISWMARGQYPEMPFNQQMSVPVTLSLKGAGDDVVLTRWPIAELETLRQRQVEHAKETLEPGDRFAPNCGGSLFDLNFEVVDCKDQLLNLLIRGKSMVFAFEDGVIRFNEKAVPLPSGNISVRILIDRTSIELFVNEGQISANFCFLPGAYEQPIVFHSPTHRIQIKDLEVHELRGIWPN